MWIFWLGVLVGAACLGAFSDFERRKARARIAELETKLAHAGDTRPILIQSPQIPPRREWHETIDPLCKKLEVAAAFELPFVFNHVGCRAHAKQLRAMAAHIDETNTVLTQLEEAKVEMDEARAALGV